MHQRISTIHPEVSLNTGEINQKPRHHYNVFIVASACKKMLQEVYKAEIDRIAISMSRKAYDALLTFTNQLNEKNHDNQKKPFTIEEVLEEEIFFLFSDEWKKE